MKKTKAPTGAAFVKAVTMPKPAPKPQPAAKKPTIKDTKPKKK
jgi:hypothetical protein